MKKSLFSDEYRHTHEADELDSKARNAILPIFQHFIALGYSPREISHVIHGTITEIELDSVLSARM